MLSPGSDALLAAMPGALDEVLVRVLDAGGTQIASYGTAGAGARAERRCTLPQGLVVASFPAREAAVAALVESLLAMVGQCECLESDMESMNASSLLLLDQVAMLTETLPRLPAGTDERDIALLGARACLVAASVQQVIYLANHQGQGVCEVLVHCHADESAPAGGTALETLQPADQGVLAAVLARAEGVVIETVPAGRRLGAPGSPEHLAHGQMLGVPVTYGAGDKRVLLGALLLVDKRATQFSTEDQLGSVEGQVAESFAAMLGAVLGARKTAELGKELSLAREIQRQILPERAVAIQGFDVAADYQACGAVGGDYFDYVPLADGRTLVVVADVSGHNLASGMMMVSARATLRTLASVRREPAPVFADLAAAMFEDLRRTERFLTAAAVAVRAGEREVEFVGAGHNDLLVYRLATDRVESVPSDGTILGFVPEPIFRSRRIELSPGDCLLLFTDGITEAMDVTGEMFGDARLAALFTQLAYGRTARGIVDGLAHELQTFRGGQAGRDDVTAVVIRCVGTGGRR